MSDRSRAGWTREDVSRLVELERGQLGHDLHDDLIPLLFVARAAAERLASQDSPQAAELRQLSEWLESAMQCGRRLLGSIQTPQFHSESWHQRVIADVRMLDLGDAQLNWDVDDSADHLPEFLAMPAYRITVEAIRNAVRHGKAKTVSVQARIRDREAADVATDADPHGSILIIDDGVGFDPSAVTGDHYGLQIMRSRAELAGGVLTVQSHPAGPTSVEFRF